MGTLFNIIKALISGFTTGILISLPLGPAAIESVNHTISKGFKNGFIVSLGAISADMTYLFLINCGLAKLLQYNKVTEGIFWIISGFILVIMQYNDLKKLGDYSESNSQKYATHPFLSGFVLTFTNPMTPTLWLGLSGTVINLWKNQSIIAYHIFLLAILIGMIFWFATLNYMAYKGFNIFKNSNPKKASIYMKWFILFLGIAFVIFGLIKLIYSIF